MKVADSRAEFTRLPLGEAVDLSLYLLYACGGDLLERGRRNYR
jgi:hypothetical protein